MLALLEGLQNEELHRQVKPHVVACLGDVADAIGPGFDKYTRATRAAPPLERAARALGDDAEARPPASLAPAGTSSACSR